MQGHTLDLFSSPPPGTDGAPAYACAFDDWLTRRQSQHGIRQTSSIAVYRSMWEAFTKWCVARGIGLQALQSSDIDAFLHSRSQRGELSDRHAWRLLRLLDAVLAQAARTHGCAANRAAADLLQSQPQWRYANAADRDTLPECLTGQQARRLVAWLLDERSGYATTGAPAGSWQALRNRSACALQLGAGLTPGDVRAALVGGVALDHPRRAGLPWRIRIPRHGAVAERDAPVAAWAGRLLRAWLDTRAALPVPGEVLFPGTRDGRVWAKVSQYMAATSVLAAAGIDCGGGGSFVLRHTFALRQLGRGRAAEDVARWLGVRDPAVMERYRRVAFEPEDVA
jgi:site-specific recombinase XerD